jgi:hypothetical protein
MKIAERAFRTYVFAKYPTKEAVALCRALDEVIQECADPSGDSQWCCEGKNGKHEKICRYSDLNFKAAKQPPRISMSTRSTL